MSGVYVRRMMQSCFAGRFIRCAHSLIRANSTMGDSANDNTLASNNSEMFSDDELIMNHKSDQVKVSDHSKTYAQVRFNHHQRKHN